MRRGFRPSAIIAVLLAMLLAVAAPGAVRATACHDTAAPIAMSQAPDNAGPSDRGDHHGSACHCTADGLCCVGGCTVGIAIAEPWRLALHLPRVSVIRCDLSARAIRGVAMPPALGPPRRLVSF